MAEPESPAGSFFLFERRSGRWLKLFDGVELGNPRGNEKFAVDLQRRANHCRVEIRDGALQLVDLGSPLGTEVNGQFVPYGSRSLRTGDRLVINGQEWTVEWQAETAARGPAEPETRVSPIKPPPSTPEGLPPGLWSLGAFLAFLAILLGLSGYLTRQRAFFAPPPPEPPARDAPTSGGAAQ